MEDKPRSLAVAEHRRTRLSMLDQPHIAPLTKYVLRLRELGHGDIPFFDPMDGGIHAPLLFIQQNPGPKAIKSGFISRNNDDPTAQNLFEIFCEAGIPRKKTLLWNIVPWYDVSKPPEDRRNVTPKEVKDGAIHLQNLMELLTNLRVMVAVGQKSRNAISAATASGAIILRASVHLMHSHHTSQLALNGAPGRRKQILDVWKSAYKMAVN
ncbi:MAG: uracil-DNA glycosylase [Rhodospirillaceae bacterium]|nr:uracil-DNA glycosylase [Rhodospirillaceae bacterium]